MSTAIAHEAGPRRGGHLATPVGPPEAGSRTPMLDKLFRPAASPPAALYDALVAQARDPVFYGRFGVPDTLDGRYETLVVHVFLGLHRLTGGSGRSETDPRALAAAQSLYDRLFADMDANLRELGAGDLGVRRRIHDMAEILLGRVAAYGRAVESGDLGALAAALRRNLYATAEPADDQVRRMARYVMRESRRLAAVPTERLVAGRLGFGPPDGPASEDIFEDTGEGRAEDGAGPRPAGTGERT